MKYSTKVHCLSFHEFPPGPHHQSILETIAQTRTTLNILPNLHTLHWDAEEPDICNLCIIFMHANIKNFIIDLPFAYELESPHFLFEEISSRMPHLTNIKIRSSIAMHNIETEMISLISQLPKLKEITLPRFYLTTKFAEALSRLPDLVAILPPLGRASGVFTDVKSFAPNLIDNAFPSLLIHSMTTTFHDAARFLKTKFSPTNITRLYVESNTNETPFSVYSLLSTVSENCHVLRDLDLYSYPAVDEDPDLLADHHMTIDILKPLLKLSRLRCFNIVHQCPLALNQKDIELLASSWPLLRHLNLNHQPIHYTQSSLTLEALIPFAKHCPELKTLHLFVDASSNDDLFSQVDLVPFKNLQNLNMGFSIITKTDRVALCLSGILPLNCKVESVVKRDQPSMAFVHTSSQLKKHKGAWALVADLLPTLYAARMQERERTRYLLLEKDSKPEQLTASMDDG